MRTWSDRPSPLSPAGSGPGSPAFADSAPWWQRALLSIGWLLAVVASVVVLHRLGSGTLATPPWTDSDRLQVWLDERDSVTVAFALLRLFALGLAWYLLAATTLGLVARAGRIPGLVAVVDLATVPALRRFLGAVAGLGLTASAATLVVNATMVDDRPAIAVDQGQSLQAGSVIIERLPDGSMLIIERLPDGDNERDGTATMRVVSPDGTAAPGPTAWTAAAGDDFWHIAEATLVDAWGRPPADVEVAPYWQAIVDANQSRLADQSNPDLIYPGQVFALPAPPPAPR